MTNSRLKPCKRSARRVAGADLEKAPRFRIVGVVPFDEEDDALIFAAASAR